MCIGAPSTPKVPPPPQQPKVADAGVQAAGDEARKRAAASFGSAATDVTGGALAPASTIKKSATTGGA